MEWFWRWLLTHLAIVFLSTMLIGVGVEWYLTSRVEEEFGAKMTVDLADGTSVHVDETDIEAVRGYLASDAVRPNVVADECGAGYGELLSTPAPNGRILKHDVMELNVAGKGPVCLIDGQVLSVGDLRVVASEIGKQIADPNSNGQLTAEQIEVYRIVPKRNVYLSIFLGVMTLVIGSVLGIWFDVKARQHESERALKSSSSSGSAEGT